MKQPGDYDADIKYISRKDRPEWDYVGMVGVLPVRDDGTKAESWFTGKENSSEKVTTSTKKSAEKVALDVDGSTGAYGHFETNSAKGLQKWLNAQ